MLNGLKPYNYLTYVMEQMKALGTFPEKEALLEIGRASCRERV